MHGPLHPLRSSLSLPERLNNPFCYEPHPLALLAAETLQQHLPTLDVGKMFGVLVVQTAEGQLAFLAAYSGQTEAFLHGEDWQEADFVPPVFDYLQPDGYFKTHEAEITALNGRIHRLQQSAEYIAAQAALRDRQRQVAEEIQQWRDEMAAAKRQRDERRKSGKCTPEEERQMIAESQFQKAELKRRKQRCQEELAAYERAVAAFTNEIAEIKRQRKQLSDALQQWLFTAFQVADSRGGRRSLLDIFHEAIGALPPSGAGECCEPKLLHYAFTHGLRPVTMAMFWWGESPKGEVRHHGQFYPACQGKCRPLLSWMLRDFPMDDNALEQDREQQLEVIYEDAWLAVVCKPAGMLSVPGKSARASVQSIMMERWGLSEGPVIVHRLDMDTSGLMVVARTKEAHYLLQQQFLGRKAEKTYVAVLSRPLPAATGTIALPLRPDLDDRPRQMVDFENGKSALTLYNIIGTREGYTLVELSPRTGRTHQLRVHCAHRDGLDAPIVGDRLYGCVADRLYLHAARLSITHPISRQPMTFERWPKGGLWDTICG